MIQKIGLYIGSIIFWKLMGHFTKRAVNFSGRTVRRKIGL